MKDRYHEEDDPFLMSDLSESDDSGSEDAADTDDDSQAVDVHVEPLSDRLDAKAPEPVDVAAVAPVLVVREPAAPVVLVASASETCSKEVREEQLRQTQVLLMHLPDSEFIWDGKPHCQIPKPIRYLYASGLDPAQAQQWLQMRFASIDDSLVVHVTTGGPATKLKSELSARLHTWWSDGAMGIDEDSKERKCWFVWLRNLARTELGAEQYQLLGLLDKEKKLKRIARQAHTSEKAAKAAVRKRAFYDVFLELSGERDSEELGDVYPVDCNASAIQAILNCLEPPRIVQHASTLRFICKHLGYLDRVQQKLIVDADDVDEADLEGPYRLTTKARCVLRLKELLSEQLSEIDYSQWWSSRLHCFCRTRERFAVLQGLPGLAQLYIHQARLEQTIKVVSDHGDCFYWDKVQRIWSKSDATRLDCEFLKLCNDMVGAEESSLHLETVQTGIKRSKPNGDEEVIADPMVATMLKSAHQHSKRLNEGSFASTYRKLLIVGLRDPRFEELVDTDAPDFFPIRGGMLLDLRTGEVRPRVSTDHFSFESVACFHRDLNGYQNAETFLLRICGGVPPQEEHLPGAPSADTQRRARNMLRSLQVNLGYLLTGQATEKSFLQHHGVSNTGESTVWGLMKKMMSEFHTVVSPALITAMAKPRNGHEHSAGFEPLFGKRLVTCEEVPQNLQVDSALLKLFTSGGLDHLPVRGCGARETRILDLKFKIVLVLNQRVKFAENVDHATVKRALVYAYQTQFDRSSPASQNVAGMVESQWFLDEFFSYLAEGAIFWYKGGTPDCEIVTEATKEFQHSESPIDAFIDEWCTRVPSADSNAQPLRIEKDTLLKECKAWYKEAAEAGASGYEVGRDWPKKHDLKRLLADRNIFEKQVKVKRTGNVPATKPYFFLGLRLLPESERPKRPCLPDDSLEYDSDESTCTAAPSSPAVGAKSDLPAARSGEPVRDLRSSSVAMIESIEDT